MNFFRRCLSERCADVTDWIDYRPDANFWSLFAIPPVLSAFWAYAGPIALGIVLGFALLAAVSVTILVGLSILGWIMARTIGDAVSAIRFRPTMVPNPVRIPSRIA